jgi:acyl-CoA thioester hydrolase
MKLKYQHKTQIRVRYGETDQMGYCYYGNYAQYFEVGRVETMRELGMSYRSLEESGVMLPVSEFHVNYKNPAFYDDLLTVTTQITELKGPRLLFEYVIHNESGDEIAIATTTLVFVSKETMRPIQPPSDFQELVMRYRLEE